MSVTKPVRIIPSTVVFRFSKCVITLSQTSSSTGCTESEVISAKRRTFANVPDLTPLFQTNDFFTSLERIGPFIQPQK
jgi:hypothetical protein